MVDTAGMVSIRRARRKQAAPATSTRPDPEPRSAATAGASAVAAPPPAMPPAAPPVNRTWRQAGPLMLLQAAHPKQAFLTAATLAAAAALAGRPAREMGLVFVTVLVGQAIVGWHNDLVDRKRDASHEAPGKPLAQGLLEPGTAWFAIACAALLVVPLAIGNGVTAGIAYLAALVISLLGNLVFRKGLLSWLPWAVSYALYPAFLSYGGWGGEAFGAAPEVAITVLAAALGVCVHFLRALPGLVADNKDGFRHLPLRVALRLGAPRLLWITIVVTVLVVAGLLLTGSRVGLAQ